MMDEETRRHLIKLVRVITLTQVGETVTIDDCGVEKRFRRVR